jgi:hypothetical protein
MRPERDDTETRGPRGLGKGDVRWVVEVSFNYKYDVEDIVLENKNGLWTYTCSLPDPKFRSVLFNRLSTDPRDRFYRLSKSVSEDAGHENLNLEKKSTAQ